MAAEIRIVEEAKAQVGMNPKKFALWLFMVSVIMIFGALTSAYIVRQAAGNWMEFEMPSMFYVTTALIIVSSLTMHIAHLMVKRNNIEISKVALIVTAILGVGFLIGQILGYQQLIENRVHLVGLDSSAVSGSFMWIIFGLHAAHVISGVIVLIVSVVTLFKNKINRNDTLEMCATYWHFLGGLWLYLFVFVLLNR